MAKDTDLPTVDEETLQNLEQVRKGKARKFVLVCKGTTIVSLVIYKKGSLDKFKKQAKESGTGQLFHGTVDGRGPDLRFALSRAEGFTKEPVKPLVLKTFLEGTGEFKYKPHFEIVDLLGPLLDEDDPLVQRFIALQEQALAACDGHPERAEEINRLCLEIGNLLEQDSRDDATTKLESLEGLLGKLSVPKPTTTQQQTTTQQPVKPTTEQVVAKTPADELEARLKQLRGEIEQLEKAGLDVAGYADALAKIDEHKEASRIKEGLMDLKVLIGKLGDRYRERSREIAERLQKHLSVGFTERTGDIEKIKTVFGFAQERGETQRFGSALVALENVDKLLQAAASSGAPKESDVIQAGTVASRKRFVESRWQEVVQAVKVQLERLRKAIELHESSEEADELATGIEDAVEDFCDDLNRAILAVDKADEENRKPIELALKTIGDYRKRIAGDPLIQHLSDVRSELGADVDIASMLTSALDELESRLAA